MHKFIVAFLLLIPTSCGMFGKDTPEPIDATPIAALPAWDGAHILCGENVNYNRNNREPFPEFANDDRLGFCARTIRYLELHRQYGHQTEIFGVAAAVTTSFAATYAPFVRRAYSRETWDIVAQLSAELEPQFQGFANDFAAGTPKPYAEMNHLDQEMTNRFLETLHQTNPDQYATLIEELSGTLNPTNPMLLAAINRNPFFAAYEAGLAHIRQQIGGNLDYGSADHRAKISLMLRQLFQGITDNTTEL